ncbi:Ger(x)C family spore germination protein [Paenibacillus harenae]|uniref:Ger(x)C family spore germination protein n=1 Tax=Paenibacillus harenae TaxID=306543 RepID=UPI0003F8E8C7|nr:Ger(x)C family spore germination protein [Paenibacillus harenae]
MNLRKRIIKGLIVLTLALPLSGCWDNIDINHRVLPVVLGISKSEGIFHVFLQISEPVTDRIRIKIVSGSGRTITHAIDRLSMNMEEHVDLLHVKIVLLDKQFAMEGMSESIVDFMRARDISPKALVAICDEDLPSFFDKVKKGLESQGTILFDFFEKNAGWNPQISLTRVWQVYRSIHSFTRDVAIPIVRSGKTTAIEHIGSAVIKNGRMVARISPSETLLFNAFNGESTQGSIEVMNHASVLITANTMRNTSSMIGDTPYMKSTIRLKVVLLETRGQPTNEMIREELDKLLTERFNAMFGKIQAVKADILGLGQFYRHIIPRESLADWREEYYPRLQLEMHIETNIQNTGFLNTP